MSILIVVGIALIVYFGLRAPDKKTKSGN